MEHKLHLVKALYAVPADYLQTEWLKQNYDIGKMLWQEIKKLPSESMPHGCALWARLCWLDWQACSLRDKNPTHMSAPDSLLWKTAAEGGCFVSVLTTACTQVGKVQTF